MNFTRNYISNQKSLFFSISPIPSHLSPFLSSSTLSFVYLPIGLHSLSHHRRCLFRWHPRLRPQPRPNKLQLAICPRGTAHASHHQQTFVPRSKSNFLPCRACMESHHSGHHSHLFWWPTLPLLVSDQQRKSLLNTVLAIFSQETTKVASSSNMHSYRPL